MNDQDDFLNYLNEELIRMPKTSLRWEILRNILAILIQILSTHKRETVLDLIKYYDKKKGLITNDDRKLLTKYVILINEILDE